MTLVQQYLNLDFNKFDKFIDNSEKTIKLSLYQKLCNETDNINDRFVEYCIEKLIKFLDTFYDKISSTSNDINYYIQQIYSFIEIRFTDILNKLDIAYLISYIDFNNMNNHKTYREIIHDIYNNSLFDKIINSSYKLAKQMEYKSLYEQITTNYNNISIDNLVTFCQILNKLNYQKIDINNYLDFIINKFDDVSNIKKLLTCILKENNSELTDNNKNNKFRFIISNLKSNGYLLFEQYLINLKDNTNLLNIDLIKNNLSLVKLFIKIISKKDNNNVNRYVNEILIITRDYIYDLQDNYNNNIAFQKINVINKFNKYPDNTISKLNRNNCKFQILKYNNIEDDLLLNYKLNDTIKIYLDIYESYYKSRYPDRNIDFDIIKSTLVIKMKFGSQYYFIHMALIQYMVMDIIMKSNNGINITNIAKLLGLELVVLQNTFNSLLKIKLIKRTMSTDNTLDTIEFLINDTFNNDTRNISITNLLNIQKKSEKVHEYLHDRNTIILSNIIDYGKKNKFFSEDVLLENISYKIPFKIEKQMFDNCLQDVINKEFFEKIQMNNDILYKYIEP